MADPNANSGIRAEVGRPLAMLRKDNYRAWASKLKAQLKVMDCWRLVSGAKAEPPATLPAGSSGVQVTAAALIRAGWLKRRDRASAVLITSISDDELHTVLAVEDDPIRVWNRREVRAKIGGLSGDSSNEFTGLRSSRGGDR